MPNIPSVTRRNFPRKALKPPPLLHESVERLPVLPFASPDSLVRRSQGARVTPHIEEMYSFSTGRARPRRAA